MILKQNKGFAKISETFRWMSADQIEPYCDATCSEPVFLLQLVDCWRSLAGAREAMVQGKLVALNIWEFTPEDMKGYLWI